MRVKPRVFAAAVCALLATACGSTVAPHGGQALGGASDGSGLAAPAANGLQGGTDGLGTSVTGTGPGTGSTAAGGATSSGSLAGGAGTQSVGGGNSSSGGSVTGGGPAAPGVTADKVAVGITYVENQAAAAAAFGVDASTGNEKSYVDAVVRYVNKTGGINGRKLEPVYVADDATSQQNKDAEAQARCTKYTQDNSVFAVLESSNRPAYVSCITKKSLLIAGADEAGHLSSLYRQYPYYFNVSALAADKEYQHLVPSLLRQSYFSGWNSAAAAPAPGDAVIGVLSIDYPSITEITDKVLLPALARAGHPVKPENLVRIYNGNSPADSGRTITEIQSAVLRFRTNGVTHAIIMDAGGQVMLFFTQNAEGQSYYPRYGVTTLNGVEALVELGNMSKKQATGAVGLGWYPAADIPQKDNPDNGPYSNDMRRRCVKVYKDAQISIEGDFAKAAALNYCDKILFFTETARKAGSALTRDSFRAAAESWGTSLPISLIPQARFDANHHYGIVRGFDMMFDSAGCGCMKYVGTTTLD